MVAERAVRVMLLAEREDRSALPDDAGRSQGWQPAGRVVAVPLAIEATRTLLPDVVIAEVRTLERLQRVAEAVDSLRPAKVVVLSALPAELTLLTAMGAGAKGFVREPVEPGFLEQAVSAVAVGRMYVDPRSTRMLVELAVHGYRSRPRSGLTLRQAQVVQLVRGGFTNRQIGEALGLSADTVKSHLQKAMRHLGAHDRWAATAIATHLEQES